jgi:hypothetical protein
MPLLSTLLKNENGPPDDKPGGPFAHRGAGLSGSHPGATF